MIRFAGRRQPRARRMRPLPALPAEDVGVDYDATAIMQSIDMMPRAWRDLVNEHGFTAVMKVLRETADLATARRALAARHDMRQRQLAQGSV